MTVNQSLCFEDLPLGEEWVTRGRTVSESELTAYIGLAGDFNPLYADRQAAGQGPNQGVLIPGALIIAVAFGLGSIDLPPSNIVALVGTTWRFLQTVRVGDTLHTRWRLNRKRPVENPIWGLAVWQIEVFNQGQEIVAAGEVIRLIERKKAPVSEVAEAVIKADSTAIEPPAPRRRRRRRPSRPANPDGEQSTANAPGDS